VEASTILAAAPWHEGRGIERSQSSPSHGQAGPQRSASSWQRAQGMLRCAQCRLRATCLRWADARRPAKEFEGRGETPVLNAHHKARIRGFTTSSSTIFRHRRSCAGGGVFGYPNQRRFSSRWSRQRLRVARWLSTRRASDGPTVALARYAADGLADKKSVPNRCQISAKMAPPRGITGSFSMIPHSAFNPCGRWTS
jgi:hypothetical protein